MGTEAQQTDPMGRRRALLTDSERRRIASDPDEDEQQNYRYQAISRVRNKIQDELPEDVQVLQENHSDLLGELREVVCPSDAVKSAAIAQATLRETERELAACQREREKLRTELDTLQEQRADVEVGDATDSLSDALDALSRFRDAHGDEVPTGAIEDAEGDIEATLEVLQDDA